MLTKAKKGNILHIRIIYYLMECAAMYDFEKMDKRYIVFGNIFLLANRLQTVLDSVPQEITAKQWLVLIMLGMFDAPPTLKQLARICDSSHQNTKQIVLKLEAKGFVRIEKDRNDGRAMRIVQTEKCRQWDEANKKFATQFIDEMFAGLSFEEILVMCEVQQKLYKKLELIKENIK